MCKTANEAAKLSTRLKVSTGNVIVVFEDPQDILIIGNATEALWNNEMINVMVIVLDKKQRFRVFTLDPFRDPHHCFDGSPVESDPQSLLQETHLHSNVFRNNLFTNFNGCKFKLSSFTGYGIEIIGQEGTWKLIGGPAVILDLLSNMVNFTFEVIPVVGKELWGSAFNTSAPGLRGAVMQKRVHFGVQLFFHLDVDLFSYDDNTRVDCLGICIPKVNIPISFWWALTSEFSDGAWIMIFVTLAFTCCTLKLLAVFSKSERLRDPVVIVIGQILSSNTVRPVSLQSRILMSHFFVFCLVITTVYRAIQGSRIVAPKPLETIASLQEFISSEMTLSVYETDEPTTESFPSDLRTKCRILSDEQFADFYHNMSLGKTAILTTKIVCSSYPSMRKALTPVFDTYMLPDYCTRLMHGHYFIFRKNSPLAATFAKASEALGEIGVMPGRRSDRTRDKQRARIPGKNSTAIRMENFLPVLVIWAVGLYFGGVLFILERCSQSF